MADAGADARAECGECDECVASERGHLPQQQREEGTEDSILTVQPHLHTRGAHAVPMRCTCGECMR